MIICKYEEFTDETCSVIVLDKAVETLEKYYYFS
jgi:hypothetical protein